MNTTPDHDLTLLGHLRELRKRIINALIAIVIGLGIASIFARDLFDWLQTPLLAKLPADSHFITLSLSEGWLVYFKVAAIAGVALSTPFWLYQMWAFIAPGLMKRERRLLTSLCIFSSLLFLAGSYFCYRVVMPFGFSYLISMLDETGIVFLPQMKSYLNFGLAFMLGFGLVFQTPLIIIFLVRWGVVEVKTLAAYRRHMIVAAFIIGAILTPPDVVSQLLMSVPLVLLFELGLLVARLFQKKSVNERQHVP
ncbi:MAG: twin-arginine translocase subunit TatC [Deltaproteobacteria bacterium]|nr:twin-arginine translocase subunit TatC [Deltaproteobacteria bacterium]